MQGPVRRHLPFGAHPGPALTNRRSPPRAPRHPLSRPTPGPTGSWAETSQVRGRIRLFPDGRGRRTSIAGNRTPAIRCRNRRREFHDPHSRLSNFCRRSRLSVAPAQAKPEPIRGFQVTVRTSRSGPAPWFWPGGRKAQLQQFDDGRWVTVARDQNKRTKATRGRVGGWHSRPASPRRRAVPGRAAGRVDSLRAQSGKGEVEAQEGAVTFTYPQPPTSSVVSWAAS